MYVQANGIVSGDPTGTYRPDDTLNRAELTKIVMEATGNAGGGEMCFPDVQKEWFARYVCGAELLGIISGNPDGTFRPSDAVNFSEAAKIIAGAWQLDTPDIGGPWYARYVSALDASAAVPQDITAFDQPLTRGQMAEMMYRLHAGIHTLPARTYMELSGDTSVSTPVEESPPTPSSAPSAPATIDAPGYPKSLDIDANWQNTWDLRPMEETDEMLPNIEVIQEDGAVSSFFRAKFAQGSGNRHLWAFFSKALGGIVTKVDPKIEARSELYLRYKVRFPTDFDFHKGGTLPGVVAGIDQNRDEANTVMVALGWEKDGKIKVTGKFSDKDQRLSNFLPGADFFLADGQWHTVDLKVALNTQPDRPNGIIEAWYDTEKVASASSILFPTRTGDLWDGLWLDVEMGSKDVGSTSPKDQYVDLGGFEFSEKRLAQ